jgi:type I restriction enzyme R subunit
MQEGQIELADEGREVSVPTESGTGSKDDDEVELSTLIEKINDALGTDFTAADELFLEQLKEDALEEERLRRSAKVNSEDNFAHEFDDALQDLFIERMDQNQDLFAKYMDDPDFRELVTKLLRSEVYEESQEASA